MVSINAGLVMGPDLTVTNPYLKGAAEMYEDGVFVTVDLDYLVEAHICVYEDISTYGRYLCFNHIINQNEDAIKLAKMLSSLPSSPQRYYIYYYLILFSPLKIIMKFKFLNNSLNYQKCKLLNIFLFLEMIHCDFGICIVHWFDKYLPS